MAAEKSAADKKPEEDNSCKLIVRNLSYDTKDEDLQKYYEQWGTVEECKIMRDKNTQKSRGFAVIRYTKAEEAEDAMGSRPHEVDERTLEPHRAAPRVYSRKLESHHTCKEIFVGKWVPECTEEQLREYFGTFGTIEEVTFPKDKKDETKFRDFAVIKFDDYDPVDRLCHTRFHTVGEHKLDITKWIDRKNMNILKRKFGRDDRNQSNGGGADINSDVLQALLVKALGGDYQGGALAGALKGKGRGGKKPYGKKGQWM